MRYIFYTTGDLEEIAKFEVRSLVELHGGRVISEDQQIVIAETTSRYFHRLSMVHDVSSHLFSCDIHQLKNFFSEMKIPKGTLCVRVRKIGKKDVRSVQLEKELGAILWSRGAEISVSNPDSIIRVYLSRKAHVGVLKYEVDAKQFLERRPDRKPFFRPGAILPRFARALVNISQVRQRLIDPMCGTGTILIETGLMGIDFAGVEVFKKIARGCMQNLNYYGLPRNVLIGDASKLPFRSGSFDGLVTDFPYLQSSRSYGELEELYQNALPEFHRVLRKGCRAVMISNMDVDNLIREFFTIEEKFLQRVHKSLTRRIFVARKI